MISVQARKNQTKKITSQIENGLFWSLIADETTDIGRIEQMCFVVRYADNNLNIQERFLGFFDTPDTKSDTLFTIIKEKMVQMGLSKDTLVGQGLDGAANMSGLNNGLCTLV